jgi:hypothetical protein
LCLAGFTACRLPPDRESLKPLPQDGQLFSYDEILSRARAQAGVALEAFFVDDWSELEEAAQGLEQTALFFPKTTMIPAAIKGKLAAETGLLQKEAVRLRDAARKKNAALANETLQRIHQRIRVLRVEPEPPSPPAKPPKSAPGP